MFSHSLILRSASTSRHRIFYNCFILPCVDVIEGDYGLIGDEYYDTIINSDDYAESVSATAVYFPRRRTIDTLTRRHLQAQLDTIVPANNEPATEIDNTCKREIDNKVDSTALNCNANEGVYVVDPETVYF